MSNELVVRSDQSMWNEKQVAALRSIGLEGASNAEMAVFLNYCQRTGLDPFARQIYMINRGGRWTIQASIDGLRIVAQRSGEYAGQTTPMWCGPDGEWTDVWLDAAPPVAARVGVYRQGFVEPLVAVARFDSYCPMKNGQPMGLWKQMPDVMLSKVAEALALRKAFPNDLSGIYTSDEMDQSDAPREQAKPVEVVQAEPVDESQVEQARDLIAAVDLDESDEAALKVLWQENAHLLDVHVDGTTLRDAIVERVNAIRDAATEVAS